MPLTRKQRWDRYREGLNLHFLPIYEILEQILDEHWAPTQGLRTIAEQDKLYAQGRTTPGKKVTNAKGGQSAHNYGTACDFAWFEDGKVEWPSSKDKRMLEFAECVEKAGGKWGGNFVSFKDTPHVELPIDVSWSSVYRVYKDEGRIAAYKYIEDHRE